MNSKLIDPILSDCLFASCLVVFHSSEKINHIEKQNNKIPGSDSSCSMLIICVDNNAGNKWCNPAGIWNGSSCLIAICLVHQISIATIRQNEKQMTEIGNPVINKNAATISIETNWGAYQVNHPFEWMKNFHLRHIWNVKQKKKINKLKQQQQESKCINNEEIGSTTTEHTQQHRPKW